MIVHKPPFPYPLRAHLPIADGLQAWYSLADGSGVDVHDSVGGAPATLRDQAPSTAWTSGPAGCVLQTSKLTGGYLDTNRSAFGTTELFADAGEQFTLFARLKPTVDLGIMISRGTLTGTFSILAAGGNLTLYLRNAATLIASIDGGWHDYVFTWDGTTARIYVDGVFVSNANVGVEAKQAKDLIVAATDSDTPSTWLNTGIDLVGVWDRALVDTEIAWLQRHAYGLAAPERVGSRVLAGLFNNGGHVLVRWSGDRLPIPSIDGSTSRTAEIVGHAPSSATEIKEFAHVTHQDVVYHYATVQVSGGGKRGKLQVDEIVTRVFDKGELVDVLPNTPSRLSVSATPDLRPVLRWIYSGKRERALPDHFDIFVATRLADFNFAAPLASVAFSEKQSQYEWVGDPLSLGDERFYTVRAVTVGGVAGLIPRVAMSPSALYSSVDRFQTARLRIPDSTPAGVAGVVGEVP